MRLQRLEATNFAMHASLDVDLSQVSAVAVVGENGAGKSRLLDAVTWCLFGRPVRGRPDQLIRHGETSMAVRTTWEHDGHDVVVRRTRETAPAAASSLELYVDGERMTGHTIGETEAQLVRLVCPPWLVLQAGPIMAQGESDWLMQSDPRERKDVLGRLFGLDEYEAFHEQAKLELGRAQARETMLMATAERLRDRVAKGETLREAADQAAAEVELAREEVERRSDAIAEIREEAIRMQHRAERIAELDRLIANAQQTLDAQTVQRAQIREQVDRKASVTWQITARDPIPDEEIEAAEREASALADARAEHGALGFEIVRLRGAVEAAEREGLCDRCPYGADARKAPEEIEQARIAEARVDRLILNLQGADERLDALRREQAAIAAERQRYEAHARELALIEGMETMLATVEATIDQAGAELRQRNAERLRLQQDMAGKDDLASQLQAASESLRRAGERRDEAEGLWAMVRTQVAEWEHGKQELAETEEALAALNEQVATLDVVRRMFHRDGIPLMVLERGLPMIEARANDVLSRLPGGIRVSLVTSRETKQGGLRDALDVMVEQEGFETVYEVLSGAERFRVDFALRLGVAEVLTQRTGKAFETLWLDEPFSAQSPAALETVLECLSAVADQFGLMIVVTHQPEVADRFPTRLVVTKEEGIATVALQS